MPKVEPRNVSPVIGVIRDVLLGRKFNTPLRFAEFYAPRTQPQPDLPKGPNDKLSDNYYCSHDPRHEVSPPLLLASYQKQLAASDSKLIISQGVLFNLSKTRLSTVLVRDAAHKLTGYYFARYSFLKHLQK